MVVDENTPILIKKRPAKNEDAKGKKQNKNEQKRRNEGI